MCVIRQAGPKDESLVYIVHLIEINVTHFVLLSKQHIGIQ